MTHHDTNALETVARLDDLARACRSDARAFRAASGLVTRAGFAALLVGLAERRAEWAADLEARIRDLGGEPAGEDSVAADGWLAEAAVGPTDDEALLAVCEANEEATAARFREVMAAPDVPEEIRDVLEERAAEVEDARGRLQGLEFVAQKED